MKCKTMQRPFAIKAMNDDGTFEGYGSVFGVMDSYRDIVLPGAFAKTLSDHRQRDSMPALLWQHRSDEPIGVWEDMREDDHGLFARGRLALDTQRGKEAHSLLKMGALKGLSIGYAVPADGAEWDEDAEVLKLSEIDLWETSLVTFPANREAQVTQVRQALEEGTYPTVREMEHWLMRDAGFSRDDAQTVINKGFKALVTRDAGGEFDPEALSILKKLIKEGSK